MPFQVEIAKYGISIASNSVPQSDYPAWISLLTAENFRCTIRFRHTQTELPAASKEGDVLIINMPLAVLSNVVDLLRNEKPIYLVQGQNGRYSVGSGLEDVGSNE